MPTYDFQCPSCADSFLLDHYVPFSTSVENCGSCGAEMEKLWTRLGTPSANGYPYTTKNILPDGSPVIVESPAHERQLCKQHGVVKRDDAAWIGKEWLGYDFRTKKQKFKEGNGVGMPGCWI